MKAIKVAVFFEMMKNMMIQYSCDELQGTTFRSHFGAVGLGDAQERNGFFLAVLSEITLYHKMPSWRE